MKLDELLKLLVQERKIHGGDLDVLGKGHPGEKGAPLTPEDVFVLKGEKDTDPKKLLFYW